MSHLYKLGAFEILLWKLLDGDVVDWDKTRIAKFLAQCHLLQVAFPAWHTPHLPFPYCNVEMLTSSKLGSILSSCQKTLTNFSLENRIFRRIQIVKMVIVKTMSVGLGETVSCTCIYLKA